MISSFQSKKR